MGYLGLNLDSLVWEVKGLMRNNYGIEPNEENFKELFDLAKLDILRTMEDIINQNKEEVLNEFNFNSEKEVLN